MDLQDFWQENKRWVLGVVAGLIVFWIGGKVVETAFGGGDAVRRVTQQAAALRASEVYDNEVLKNARDENEHLRALQTELQDHVGFTPDERFVLAGKGDAELYFPVAERGVRSAVLIRAQEQGVDMDDRAMTWATPIGRDEIATRLMELCLLEHAAMRLLDAGSETRQRVPDALGLQSIDVLQIESSTRSDNRRRGRPGRRAAAELADRIDEYRVKFSFRGDLSTLQGWLDRLRGVDPPIGLVPDRFVVQPGDQIGDPIQVSGNLFAIVIHEPVQNG